MATCCYAECCSATGAVSGSLVWSERFFLLSPNMAPARQRSSARAHAGMQVRPAAKESSLLRHRPRSDWAQEQKHPTSHLFVINECISREGDAAGAVRAEV